MSPKFGSLLAVTIAILSLSFSASAQFSSLPDCGVTCVENNASGNGCAGVSDTSCLCASSRFTSAVNQCIGQTCSLEFRYSAFTRFSQACSAASPPAASTSPSTSRSSTGTASSNTASGTPSTTGTGTRTSAESGTPTPTAGGDEDTDKDKDPKDDDTNTGTSTRSSNTSTRAPAAAGLDATTRATTPSSTRSVASRTSGASTTVVLQTVVDNPFENAAVSRFGADKVGLTFVAGYAMSWLVGFGGAAWVLLG